jgi:hypothetical protein
MIRTLVIAIAIIIVAVNAPAQTSRTSKRYGSRKAGVIRFGPSTTYLKEGFSVEEVLRLLGEPAAISQHQSGNKSVTTYEFARGHNRFLIADFVNGSLVNSRTETRDQVALVDR